MITPLGIVVLALVALAVWKRSLFLGLLAASGGLPLGVALVIAGQSAPVFYTVGLVAAVLFLVTTLVNRRTKRDAILTHRPGGTALLLFVAWTIFITAVAPFVFQGISVLVARGGLDEQFLDPGTLTYTVSNAAQVVYMLIGVAIIFSIGGSRTAVLGLLDITLAVVMILSFWRLLSLYAGLPFPLGFFDNSTTVRIIETTPDGSPRFRGIFAEPSSLAAACLTAIIYFLPRLRWLSRWGRVGAVLVLIMAAVSAAVSTAGTFVAAGLVMLGLIALYGFSRFVLGGMRLPVGIAILGLVALLSSVFFLRPVLDLTNSIINEKIASSSYGSRTGVDFFSYLLILRTWGLGVGLGSNRPSSFLAMLLSCVGIPGTILFVIFVFQLARGAWSRPEYRPVVWALISVLVCKIISGPNLSDPAAILYVALGVLAHGAWHPVPERDVGVMESGAGKRLERPERYDWAR